MRHLLITLLALGLAACNATTPLPPATLAPTNAPAVQPTSAVPRLPTLANFSLRIIPTSIRPGLRLTLIAMGFADQEPVNFYFTRPDGRQTGSETVTCDLNGNAAYSFDVPDDWEAGEWKANVVSKIDSRRRAEQIVTLKR